MLMTKTISILHIKPLARCSQATAMADPRRMEAEEKTVCDLLITLMN